MASRPDTTRAVPPDLAVLNDETALGWEMLIVLGIASGSTGPVTEVELDGSDEPSIGACSRGFGTIADVDITAVAGPWTARSRVEVELGGSSIARVGTC